MGRIARMSKPQWRLARMYVFERDGWRCKKCGKPGRLECDHIIPLSVNKEQNPFDPVNLQTLCRGCHIEKTREERGRIHSPNRGKFQHLIDELL